MNSISYLWSDDIIGLQWMWQDGWPGKLIVIALVGALLAFAWVCLYLLFNFLDFAFRPKKLTTGKVLDREFTPAHSTTIYVSVGKTMMPQTTSYPDSWSLLVELEDGRNDWVECSKETYDTSEIGAPAAVEYKEGRLTTRISITDIRVVEVAA